MSLVLWEAELDGKCSWHFIPKVSSVESISASAEDSYDCLGEFKKEGNILNLYIVSSKVDLLPKTRDKLPLWLWP